MSAKQLKSYSGIHLLPAVEYVETFFSKNHLQNSYLIACQHILPSTHMMLRSAMNLGMDPSNMALIGKCYSSDSNVMKEISNEGIYVCESSSKFDPNLSFDLQFQKYINEFLRESILRMNPPQNSTIIILDDGGELISSAQWLSEKYKNVFGIEQTASGYHKLKKVELKFSVKNVALSKEKLTFETPLIADSILKNLEQKIQLSTSNTKEILVVGNGSIGKSICAKLRTEKYKQHNVAAYDLVQEKSELNYVDFSSFDLILGATGTNMLTHHYYESLKEGAAMVNVASSDREFDSVYFRKLSKQKCGIHDDVYYNGLSLLNCGFPLNFSGGTIASVPLNKIQLVCALLFLGICESASNVPTPSQFLDLNAILSEKILSKFYSIETLDDPSY
jgi:S-adenosylhomocysteine hydrolase